VTRLRIADCREEAQKAQRGGPQPKGLNHGFHGFHGLEMDSDRRNHIRAIRGIRGKTFAGVNDLDLLHCTKEDFPFEHFVPSCG
jgi:hypothetical protein